MVGKNKALTKSLEERGFMTDFGRRKIEEARKNGQWDASKPGGYGRADCLDDGQDQ